MRKTYSIPVIALLALIALSAQVNLAISDTGQTVAAVVQQDQPSDFGAVHQLAKSETDQAKPFATAGRHDDHAAQSTATRQHWKNESEVAPVATKTKVLAGAGTKTATSMAGNLFAIT